MKKGPLALIAIATVVLATYIFIAQSSSPVVKQNLKPASNIVQPKIKQQKQIVQASPQQKVVKLKHEISLCKNKSADKAYKINEINQSLTLFF
ncbi:hypothetical protein [Pseudoalteromonas sp. Z9A4]|nr:hypothetical protein [Pseudoalteromonas sp. Z9A4]